MKTFTAKQRRRIVNFVVEFRDPPPEIKKGIDTALTKFAEAHDALGSTFETVSGRCLFTAYFRDVDDAAWFAQSWRAAGFTNIHGGLKPEPN